MKKLKFLAAFAAAAVPVFCLGACAGKAGPSGASKPFDFQGNTVNPEIIIDGRDDDELWKSDNVVHTSFSSCEVSVLRRSNAVYMYYKVKDLTPYSYVDVGDADEVTRSDSIEVYLDARPLSREYVGNGATFDNDGDPVNRAQSGTYQINLGRDNRTRIMSGSNGQWYLWAGMYTFETREGSYYNGDDEYYFIEAMIPLEQMGASADSPLGIAFGHVDRHTDSKLDTEDTYKWTGMVYNGVFVEPQVPYRYLIITADGGLYNRAEYNAKG